jgi:hypothetical protein
MEHKKIADTKQQEKERIGEQKNVEIKKEEDNFINKTDEIKKLNNGRWARKNDSVILLGTAGTLAVTPWDLPDYDYWACSPVMTHKNWEGHRIDLIFEMHQMEYWHTIIKRLNDWKVPVYMQKKVPQITLSMEYPIKAIQRWCDNKIMNKFFSSTISYMIALAIFEGYKTIELYGIHMAAQEEKYSMQRNSCEAWLSYGLGKGVNFWIPPESDLFKCSYLYGYEQEKDVILRIINRRDKLQNGVNELKKKMEALKKDLYSQQGAVLDCNQIVKELR